VTDWIAISSVLKAEDSLETCCRADEKSEGPKKFLTAPDKGRQGEGLRPKAEGLRAGLGNREEGIGDAARSEVRVTGPVCLDQPLGLRP
jgi:hypothetical protein